MKALGELITAQGGRLDSLSDRIHRLSDVSAKYLTQIVTLKEELQKQRSWYDQQLQKRDQEYQQLLKMVVTQSMEGYVQKKLAQSPPKPVQVQNPADLFGLFEEVPLGDPAGYSAAELSIGGYREAAVVEEPDGK